MKTENQDDVVARLDRVLNDERSALLSGNLNALGPLLETKETLITALRDNNGANQESLAELNKKIIRNQTLLKGALLGIKTVANRMKLMREIRRSLNTYDESGNKTTISTRKHGNVERRA